MIINLSSKFELFAVQCKKIAQNLQTIVEIKSYPEYGWASIAFMTNKFGGLYVNLHYDLNTNEVVNWYGEKNERRISDISFLSYFVKEERDKMLSKRNMKKITALINAEY